MFFFLYFPKFSSPFPGLRRFSAWELLHGWIDCPGGVGAPPCTQLRHRGRWFTHVYPITILLFTVLNYCMLPIVTLCRISRPSTGIIICLEIELEFYGRNLRNYRNFNKYGLIACRLHWRSHPERRTCPSAAQEECSSICSSLPLRKRE